MDDPVGGEENTRPHYSRGDDFSTIGDLVFVAGVADDYESTKDDHEEDDETAGDVDVGEDVVDERAGSGVSRASVAALEFEGLTEVEG